MKSMTPPPKKQKKTISDMVVRRVNKVNRARTGQEVLDATGRDQHTDDAVVANMPKGDGNGAEVVFFKLNLGDRNGSVSDDDLEKEFELRDLEPVDPVSLSAVNEKDPAFADNKPNCTHWKDTKGKWCFATFYHSSGVRRVHVYRSGNDWDDFWWFAGFRRKRKEK